MQPYESRVKWKTRGGMRFLLLSMKGGGRGPNLHTIRLMQLRVKGCPPPLPSTFRSCFKIHFRLIYCCSRTKAPRSQEHGHYLPGTRTQPNPGPGHTLDGSAADTRPSLTPALGGRGGLRGTVLSVCSLTVIGVADGRRIVPFLIGCVVLNSRTARVSTTPKHCRRPSAFLGNRCERLLRHGGKKPKSPTCARLCYLITQKRWKHSSTWLQLLSLEVAAKGNEHTLVHSVIPGA